MKRSLLLLYVILITLSASTQTFKNEDIVEVDPLLSNTSDVKWKQAVVEAYDAAGKKYTVKLLEGKKITIPSKDPEKWIRPFVDKTILNKYGPGARFPYEKRAAAINRYKCDPSEAGIKNNILSMMATKFKDYSYIYIDFTSFKGQKGHEDAKFKGQQVYPYKIEMLVHLKRIVTMGGRDYTEYQTWEFDRVYEYASRPDKKCDCYALPSNDGRLISKQWYY